MLDGFNDVELSLIILSSENYNLSCRELIGIAKDKGISIKIISSFVNIQRSFYNLDKNNHISYRDLLLDTIISGRDYFYRCEDLKLALATFITVNNGNDIIDVFTICKIMLEVKRLVSFKINYNFNIDEYIKTLKQIYLL